MEIVIVSDTVRQRRSRTPLSSTSTTPISSASSTDGSQVPPNDTTASLSSELILSESNGSPSNVMPDLLPKTFHLAESSSLFSQINSSTGIPLLPTEPLSNDLYREQLFSVVEIRESNLTSPKKPINTYKGNDRSQTIDGINGNQMIHMPKVGEIINTINILESADYFEPECVETVHIIDATSETSDTDTGCSTPNLDERPTSKASIDDENMSDEYETGELPQIDFLKIEKTRISFDEHKQQMIKDRDLLRDSENMDTKCGIVEKPQRKKFTPTLKEILSATERDSFYNSDKECNANDDEPLIFSDDEDGPKTSIQSYGNRFTVFILLLDTHTHTQHTNKFQKLK